MKARREKSNSAQMASKRWLAYAGTAAASALGVTAPAEAEVHYSGPINAAFPPGQDTTQTFQLDESGDYFVLKHTDFYGLGGAFFKIEGGLQRDFRGSAGLDSAYVGNLGTGRYVSQGKFVGEVYSYGTLAAYGGGPLAKWKARGIGFIGFRFNRGAGVQYGWVRIDMGGRNRDLAFRLLDYAYADPGEPLRTGQTSSSTSAAPAGGSLGWLALGGAGLVALRGSR